MKFWLQLEGILLQKIYLDFVEAGQCRMHSVPFLNTLCSRFCSWSMLFLSLNILPSLETFQRKEIIQVIVSIKSMRMTSCKQLYSLSQPSSGVVEKLEKGLLNKVMLLSLQHLHCSLEVVMVWLAPVNQNL
uniref:Uncharacterized protein n=1 Tax=Opuntia streptacantha TaxID=393608 RepID=A0A7C9AQ12_OPUST